MSNADDNTNICLFPVMENWYLQEHVVYLIFWVNLQKTWAF